MLSEINKHKNGLYPYYMIPFIEILGHAKLIYNGKKKTQIRRSLWWEVGALIKKKNRSLWGDGNVLYVDYITGDICVYIFQKLSNNA